MKDLVQKKLDSYNPKSGQEEMNALKEITQEIALYSLQKVGFFQDVCFLGGTSLRIIHGLDRFSEDLDFSTIAISPNFDLTAYLERAMNYMNAYGYDLSINKDDLADKAVQSQFLKDDSIKKILTFKHRHDLRSKIKIKIEVDTQPPAGATYGVEYIDFPIHFAINQYDLPSLMAGKLHALLCRPYTKGRDWYDLLWYLSRGIKPNLILLKNSLFQLGPWSGKEQELDVLFIKAGLEDQVKALNWKHAVDDVRPFLTSESAETLGPWGEHFFSKKLEKLSWSN